MKKINEHNYEEFAIDYMLGNLSAINVEAFSVFLDEHPHIAEEMLLFETDSTIAPLQPQSFVNLKKEISHQRITDDNFEEYCIANMEGDLSEDAQMELSKYIGNDTERLGTKSFFEKTTLPIEEDIYPHKAKLKKSVHHPSITKRLINAATIVAAASIIAFGLFIIPQKKVNTTPQLAKNMPIVIENKAINKIEQPTSIPKEEKKEVLFAKADPIVRQTETVTEIKDIRPAIIETNEGISNTHLLLERLQSKRTNVSETNIAITPLTLIATPPKIEKQQSNSTSDLRNRTKKLLYTTVFARSIEGLNKMTETNLGYNVIEDEDGNPVRIIIKSRFGEINHTLAQR